MSGKVKPDLKKDGCLENKLKFTLDILPKKEGVYIFKDSSGKAIYIGKAKSLYNRVRSYFQGKDSYNIVKTKISYFTDKIHSIDYIVTDNEVEALILECSLIKKNRPRYNIDLKDDKSYPYIAITENEKYPRVFMTSFITSKDFINLSQPFLSKGRSTKEKFSSS